MIDFRTPWERGDVEYYIEGFARTKTTLTEPQADALIRAIDRVGEVSCSCHDYRIDDDFDYVDDTIIGDEVVPNLTGKVSWIFHAKEDCRDDLELLIEPYAMDIIENRCEIIRH